MQERDGRLSVARTNVLKHLLRSVHRMMQSPGTTEGLRGLIDSSLPKSLKKVFTHKTLFGPVVLPLAINIMSTFVHNEPTSLAIMQEQGLPEVFYDTIESGLDPSIEVGMTPASSLDIDMHDIGSTSDPERYWRPLLESSRPRPAHRSAQHHPQALLDVHVRETHQGPA